MHIDEIRKIKRYEAGTDIVTYSEYLKESFHGESKRDNGTLTVDHVSDVRGGADRCLKDSIYKPSALAAANGHDIIEDIKGIKIKNPFSKQNAEYRDNTLNYLYEEAGQDGDLTCYEINKLTRPKGVKYWDYMMGQVLKVSNKEERTIPDIITILLKEIDRNSNTDPDESLDTEHAMGKYLKLEGQPEEAFIEFYKKNKITEAFKDLEMDKLYPVQYMNAMAKRFETRRNSNAADNLNIYLPLGEELILISMGLYDGKFDEMKARENGIFDYDKVREMFLGCYEKSFNIMKHKYQSSDEMLYDFIRNNAFNRGGKDTPGFLPTFREMGIKMGIIVA